MQAAARRGSIRVLTGTAAALLTVVMAAAAAREPITGAFGLEFTEPVGLQLLAASLAEPPYPLPPGNLDQTIPEPLPGAESGWFLFVPQARPDLLVGDEVRFMVLRSQTGYPVRILAEHPRPDCTNDVLWLTRSLARKYRADDDPFGAVRKGFRQSARFESALGQVDVSCGPTLLIEYTDTGGYRRWLAAEQTRREEFEVRQALMVEQQARLEEARYQGMAEQFIAGSRVQVDGAFGIAFGEPVQVSWLATDEPVVDEPLEARLPDLPETVRDGHFTVTVGPDRVPVRVAGEFDDAGAGRFEEFSRALQAKYGTPAKDTPLHRIHKISGDYLVARHDPARGVTRLVFIDDEARHAQREREQAARQARLADQERQFLEETAGL